MGTNNHIPSRRIAILGGYNYGPTDIIRKVVNLIPKTSTLVITGSAGVSLIAQQEADRIGLPNKLFKWRCKPYALFRNADAAVVFEDTSEALQFFLHCANIRSFPVQMYNLKGKPIDFRKYLASNPNQDNREETMAWTAQAKKLKEDGESSLKITLTITESLYENYGKQGDQEKITPERAMIMRLERCVDHNASRGLYFPDADRVELERLTGGRIINSASQAVERISELSRIEVNGTTVELAPNILQRAESRAKSERITVSEWIGKEVVRSMEAAVGLR